MFLFIKEGSKMTTAMNVTDKFINIISIIPMPIQLLFILLISIILIIIILQVNKFAKLQEKVLK